MYRGVATALVALAAFDYFYPDGKYSRLQREFDELSEELKGLVVAEQRRFLREINTPKNETRRRQKVDAKKTLAA